MVNKNEVLVFLESLSEKDISDEEILQKADSFLNESCEAQDAEFLSHVLNRKGNPIELMEKYAFSGSGAAQVALGALKLEGKGVEKNVSEALFWLKRAYNSKNPKSGLLLFSVYVNGIGVKEDMTKARAFLKVSADLGVPAAQYYYAGMLLEGEGGSFDEGAAMEYMAFAADNGHDQAIEFLEANFD